MRDMKIEVTFRILFQVRRSLIKALSPYNTVNKMNRNLRKSTLIPFSFQITNYVYTFQLHVGVCHKSSSAVEVIVNSEENTRTQLTSFMVITFCELVSDGNN